MTKVIKLMEEEEGQGGSDVLMKTVDLFCSDPRNPIAYLAFSKEMRSTWLHCELVQWPKIQLSLIFLCCQQITPLVT